MTEAELQEATVAVYRYGCGDARCDGNCPSDNTARAARDLLAEVQRLAVEGDRLRALVEAAYREGGKDGFDGMHSRQESDARKALEAP